MPFPSSRRSGVDACPGALRLHTAADGLLARVRLPGGLVTGAQLGTLREVAETSGDGHVELTSRANVQLRALTTSPAGPLAEAGLLPSPTHELVRNITAAPVPAARALVRDLDRALCADPRLAELPGRFLFAIGHSAVSPDLTAFGTGTSRLEDTVPAGHTGATVLLAGHDVGLRIPGDRVVEAMLQAAHAFLDEQAAQLTTGGETRAWRLRELVDGPARVGARTAARLGVGLVEPGPPPGAPPQPPAGIVEQDDGRFAVHASVPLGVLSAVPLRVLERADLVVVTPSRGVLVPDLTRPRAEVVRTELAAAGLAVESASRWSGVTSCAGRPGCAKALADVRADATATVLAPGRRPVHWVGCARGCGSPPGAHVRVEATPSGYRVQEPGSGPPAAPVGVERVAGLVAAVRT